MVEVKYPVLRYLSSRYFMEHFREAFGTEDDVVDTFLRDNRGVAAKLLDELDALLVHYARGGLRAALESRRVYIGGSTSESDNNAADWLGWLRDQIVEKLESDLPTRFDYLPLQKVANDHRLLAVQVLLGDTDLVGDGKVSATTVEAIERAALEFFDEIGEVDWQLGILLELSDEELTSKLEELEISYDAAKLGMTRREWLELTRQTIREIGSPPAWLQ
ncbi:MAG: hypothetical protein JWN95_3886 [Frankiales bacterium]|nr:hypothetical protein [Frankiales bacterium]